MDYQLTHYHLNFYEFPLTFQIKYLARKQGKLLINMYGKEKQMKNSYFYINKVKISPKNSMKSLVKKA